MELAAFFMGILIVTAGYTVGYYHGSKRTKVQQTEGDVRKSVTDRNADVLKGLEDRRVARARDVTPLPYRRKR
jgi:hypothetical protein